MWEEIIEQKGAEREKILSETEEFWGAMKSNGSQIKRHYNTRESALKLLSYLASPDSKTSDMVLDIQSQMVDQGKSLIETSAGMEIEAEVLRERKKYEKEKAELQAYWRKAQKEQKNEMMEEIKERSRELEATNRKLERAKAGLQTTFDQLKRHERQISEIKRDNERQLSELKRDNERHLSEANKSAAEQSKRAKQAEANQAKTQVETQQELQAVKKFMQDAEQRSRQSENITQQLLAQSERTEAELRAVKANGKKTHDYLTSQLK